MTSSVRHDQLLRLLHWAREHNGLETNENDPTVVGKLRCGVIDEQFGVGGVVRSDVAPIEVCRCRCRCFFLISTF